MSDTAVRARPQSKTKSSDASTNEALAYLTKELGENHPSAPGRAKRGIIIQAAMLVFVLSYMTWILTSMSSLDAEALTAIATDKLQVMIPELREQVRDYAVAAAPAIVDRGQELFLRLPRELGARLEQHIVAETNIRMREFETSLESSLTKGLEEQIDLIRTEHPDATADEALELTIVEVSGAYRDKMVLAIAGMYESYSSEVHRLDAYLTRLKTADDLTETEKIDKELIESWLVLVHKHGATQPEDGKKG
ncbi:MAG: hypothetical protein O7H41_19425 [Planctomycetota bacterium]|nr:hypothetical protein [Planctomycetota bacterium]